MKAELPEIRIYVSVWDDQGGVVQRLEPGAFELYENGLRVEHLTLESEFREDEPQWLILALDTSGTMRIGDRMRDSKTAAKTLVQTMRDSDVGAVVHFDDKVFFKTKFTSDKSVLSAAIEALKPNTDPRSQTKLFEAIYEVVGHLAEIPSGKGRSVVVFSDGKDEGSYVHEDDCISRAREEHIPIYAIGFGPAYGEGTRSLERLATLTGGRYLYVRNTKEIAALYEMLSQRFRDQYVLTYNTSPGVRSGTWYDVKLQVTYLGKVLSDEHRFHSDSVFGPGANRMVSQRKEEGTVSTTSPVLIVVLVGAGLLLIAAVVLLIVLVRGRGGKEFRGAQQIEGENEGIARPAIPHDVGEEERVVIERKPPPRDEREDREPFVRMETRGGTAVVEEERWHRGDETVVLPSKPKHIAYLAVKEGVRKGILLRLPEKERIEMGRDEDNDIVLDDPEVSRKHMVVQWKEEDFVLFDYVSKGGTFVNGERIEGPHVLSEKDEIRAGSTVLVFLRVT